MRQWTRSSPKKNSDDNSSLELEQRNTNDVNIETAKDYKSKAEDHSDKEKEVVIEKGDGSIEADTLPDKEPQGTLHHKIH
jgi:hypothetical protein